MQPDLIQVYEILLNAAQRKKTAANSTDSEAHELTAAYNQQPKAAGNDDITIVPVTIQAGGK